MGLFSIEDGMDTEIIVRVIKERINAKTKMVIFTIKILF